MAPPPATARSAPPDKASSCPASWVLLLRFCRRFRRDQIEGAVNRNMDDAGRPIDPAVTVKVFLYQPVLFRPVAGDAGFFRRPVAERLLGAENPSALVTFPVKQRGNEEGKCDAEREHAAAENNVAGRGVYRLVARRGQ